MPSIAFSSFCYDRMAAALRLGGAARATAVALRAAAPVTRSLTDRAAGPGGLFRNRSVVNPAANQAAAGRTRLREARYALEERARPAELDSSKTEPAFETECELRDFVEMRIQESMRTGQFDNLKNKGRPLPGPPPASALDVALRIMRQNGVRPHWLQLMHDIDHEKRLVRAQLQFAWHKHMPHSPHRWELAVRVAELKIVQVNRAVDTFNLIRPMCVGHLFRLRLRMPEELQRAQESSVPEVLARKRAAVDGASGEDAHDAGGKKEVGEGKADGEKGKTAKREGKGKDDEGVGQEPRPSWQSFARFVRAAEVREYDLPTWGRRRVSSAEREAGSGQKNGR